MNQSKWSFVAAAVVLLLAAGARSAPITLFNTGVDSTGTPLPNNATSVDPHYTITTNPDVASGADGSTHVQDETAFPIVTGPWTANTTTAKWIGPRFNTGSSAGGLYEYTTSFTLPAGADPTTATISGGWAFDDGGGVGGIFLNGTEVLPDANPGFGSLTAFTIPAGSPFVAGTNVLTFQGTNGGSYTGLIVDNLTGSVTVPEPASLGLLGLGGLGLLARRRRTT